MLLQPQRAAAGRIHISERLNLRFEQRIRATFAKVDPSVKLRTYIVEDNATIRENLIGTLEELASVEAVGVAETEDEGKDWLASHSEQWDLAIVDLFLRQGSGLGVLAACRTRRPGQKMVVLSNYATPDVRMRCAQLGVDAVFDKSNEIDALVDYCIHHSSLTGLMESATPSVAASGPSL
jgi:two-component system OmpR family response regulator